MKFISHRGNLEGPSRSENSPQQVDFCLENSYDCEVDLWVLQGEFFLGHDFGEYLVSRDWLINRQQYLWIHCKNVEALSSLASMESKSLNFFWHQTDSYTLTSHNYVWVYPGSTISKRSVAVLPELWLGQETIRSLELASAICTDFVLKYQQEFDLNS